MRIDWVTFCDSIITRFKQPYVQLISIQQLKHLKYALSATGFRNHFIFNWRLLSF